MEQPETPRYATLLYDIKKQLDINWNEYVLLDMIYHLQSKTGYCYKSPLNISQDLGLTKRGVNNMIVRLQSMGLLERLTDYALRVTDKYISTNREGGNKVPTTEQTMPTSGNKVPTKTPKSGNKLPAGGNKLPKVGTNFQNNRGLELHRTTVKNNILSTNVLSGEKISPDVKEQIKKLYYDCIKAYGLPILNHSTLHAKVAAMAREDDPQAIIKYLVFMRDQYRRVQLSYKPRISTALDFYTKRVQIREAIQDEVKSQAQPNVWRPKGKATK